jgi:thiol:disulfide interchange protein/DsbC/DsbD-like thiol-disulfide interchange protein
MPALRRFLSLLALAVSLTAPGLHAQVIDGVELVRASLLADTTAVVPGKPFLVGLRLQMEPHWHTYWQYSGDAGLPTKITWQLPAGFTAGPIQWPLPEKISSAGDIENYGYSDEVLLLTEITPPAQVAPGNLTFKAKAEWLVCAQICVPGSKELDLTLPSGGTPQPDNAALFAKYRALLPHPYAEPAARFGVTRAVESNDLVWRLVGLPPAQRHDLEFFPLPPDDVQIGHPVSGDATDLNGSDRVGIRLPIISGIASAGKVDGVLRVGSGAQQSIWTLSSHDLPPLESTAPTAAHHDVSKAVPGPAAKPIPAVVAGSFWSFLGIAFLGGLILNVMPCVLPVISLKLFTFIKQANDDPRRIFRMGLAYAAGVFAWFLGFAVLVVLLKAAGRQLGYAFQLQNPWFIVALVAITFVFALNLLGVFEVILPGAISNAAGGAAASHGGYTGAFLQGILATVLGSACTAPFLGEALGFAFAQSGPVIVIMFAAIAAGMSTPFVLLAARPGWLKFLPRPGAWMERVKQATGFLMLATVLWLLSVFGGMRGVDALIWAGALLLVLGVACWVQGAFNNFTASARSRWAARAVIALLVVLGGGWCVQQMAAARPAETGAVLTDFQAQLDAALKTDQPVFVDFTASWCVNCKVNERLVLDTAPVQTALRQRNAIFLKADWSTGQADVTKLLQQFHRAAVPLYVIYPAGNPAGAIVLPELLTQRLVLDGLAAAAKAAAPHSRQAAKANASTHSNPIMIQTPNPNTHYL